MIEELVEGRVAVLLVVVAAAAGEQAGELVVRVRVVGTPAVAGDVVQSPAVALREEDAEVAADLLGLETERVAPGLGQERDARLVAAPVLKPNLSGGRSLPRRSVIAELLAGPWSTPAPRGRGSRSNGYGSIVSS